MDKDIIIKIVCYGGNRQVESIMQDYIGYWFYGIRDDYTSHIPIHFLDNSFKKPDLSRYIRKLQKYQPALATLPDIEDEKSYNLYLRYYQEVLQLSNMTQYITIIKSFDYFFDADYIGYSVPSRYANTTIPVSYFRQFNKIHLLGGTPHKQLEIIQELGGVTSIDQNSFILAARFGKVWENRKWKYIDKDFEYCFRFSMDTMTKEFE